MNHEQLTLIIQNWADKHLPIALQSGWYDNHITTIIGTSLTGSGEIDSIDVAIQGFNILLECLEHYNDLQLVLAIPLNDGKSVLKRNCPDSKEGIYRQWRTIESPSLYLIRRSSNKVRRNFIEYIHPLLYLYTDFIRPVSAFYREWRNIADPPHWEYTRSVIVESL